MAAVDNTRTRTRVPNLPSQPASPTPSAVAHVAQALHEIRAYLEAADSTVAVAAGALEGQNADIDVDIARTLRSSVRGVLMDQVERER